MKRILAMVLALCLLTALPASAEQWVVYYMSDEMVVRDDGTIVVPLGAYASIQTLCWQRKPDDPVRYAVTRNEYDVSLAAEGYYYQASMALLSEDGTLLTGFDYLYMDYDPAYGTITYYKGNGTSGVMDLDGHELFEGNYYHVFGNPAQGYVALRSISDYRSEVIICTSQGEILRPGLHPSYCAAPSEAGEPILLHNVRELGVRSVFIDQDGNMLFDRTFASAEGFDRGIAVVQRENDGPYGAIDLRGETVLPMAYSMIDVLEGGDEPLLLAVDEDGRGFGIYDAETGNAINTVSFRDRNDVNSIYVDGIDGGTLLSVHFYDKDKFYLGEAIYSRLGEPWMTEAGSDGAEMYFKTYYDSVRGMPERVVCEAGDYPYTVNWLADPNGRRCSEEFQDLEPALWQDGHGRYCVRQYATAVDREGDTILNWATVRCGVCDENGAMLLEPKYSQLRVLSLDRYWVRFGHLNGLIDGEGNWLCQINDYAYLMD